MRNVLVINYPGLQIGGIEKSLYYIMKNALNKGVTVIWLTTKKAKIKAHFSDLVNDKRLTIVYKHSGLLGRFLLPKLPLFSDDEARIFCVTSFEFLQGERYRKKYKISKFYNFLFLMNFFGGETYPEDLSFLNDLARKKRTSFSKYIAKKIYDNDCLRAFAKKQFFTYCNRYDLVVDDAFDEKILKRSFPIQHLTDEQMLSNAINRKNELILVTCTRFDFPHKGYLIGFLRAFESLLSRYGNIRLRIIGYGENEALVMNTVGEMADDVKNRIEFYGKVDPSRIFEIIKSCHLAFGLAGSASLCASAGIPTLIMRHNTFLCETYGFFHEVNSTLDDRPGSDYVPYIELIQNCTDDEYCEICKKEMYAYEQRSEYDPYYILKQNNKSSKSPFSQVDIVRNIWWSIYTAVMSRLKK